MALVIGLRYLMGWALATHPANREQPEWPPHPDRIYMALVAAHFEGDEEREEKLALEWLERQSPPALFVSRGVGRKITTSYVPVNDTQMPRWKVGATPSADQTAGGLSLLPVHRNKQAREFPTVLLEDEVLYLEWPEVPEPAILRALGRLCQRVTRVGHSASLTQMWVAPVVPASESRRRLVPTQKIGTLRLRTTSQGRLRSLSQAFEAGRRPSTASYQAYEEAGQENKATYHTSEFSEELLVLSALPQTRKFGLTSTLLISKTLHKLFLANCAEPVPEWVSGHVADGGRSEESHLAMVPLPFVGREHADGHLLGVALVVPRKNTEAVARTLGPILLQNGLESAPLRLLMGAAGDWSVALEQRDELPQALQSPTWTASGKGAMTWATVTPFVLDRHSKRCSFQVGAEMAIRDACQRIGLPEPETIEVSKVSMFAGSPSTYEFPPLLRKDGSIRRQTHCVLRFSEPIVGPVLIGAGRYRGYGFLRPIKERNEPQ